MTSALIVVDMQSEWLLEESEHYLGDLQEFVDNVNELIDRCRGAGYAVVFTRHLEEHGRGFVNGSPGAMLMSALHREQGDRVVDKQTINPFFDGTLDEVLENVDDILVCGLLTNLCVRMTVEEAYDRGFAVTVVTDCCSSDNDWAHVFTIKDLEDTRPELAFITLDEVDDVLESTPEAPEQATPPPVENAPQAPPSPAPQPTPQAPPPVPQSPPPMNPGVPPRPPGQ